MTGPRQAAQLVRLAIRAGVEAEVYRDGEQWIAVIGRPGVDIEVNWRRQDGRWVFSHSDTDDGRSVDYAKVRRLVKKGLR